MQNKVDYVKNTICAPATADAAAAIGVIRMSGPDVFSIADRFFTSSSLDSLTHAEAYRIYYGSVRDAQNTEIDRVLVSVFRAPHSYTGEDSIEISCHGSRYILARVLRLCLDNGARMATPGEFSQRAFLNGKMDLAQTEAVADLIDSENAASHRMAMNQMRGGFSRELAAMRASLVELAGLLELELDFSEEEVEFADRRQLGNRVEALLLHVSRLCDSFSLGNAIKTGIPVAIVGAVNVGKSTLLNALLGEERAIVSDEAGTTRDTVEDLLNVNGLCFRFIDTAGLRSNVGTTERLGIERSYQKIRQATVLIVVLDPTRPQTVLPSLQAVETHLADTGSATPIPPRILLVFNKSDKLDPGQMEAARNQALEFCNGRHLTLGGEITLSAKKNIGVEALKEKLSASFLPDLERPETTLLTNSRHYAALREAQAALTRTRTALETALPGDLVAQDLREALYHLGTITGEISTDEILGTVFSKFCIGK